MKMRKINGMESEGPLEKVFVKAVTEALNLTKAEKVV